MAYPFKVLNAGHSTAKQVFKVKFDQPLSSVPNLRAYDNSGTYPTSNGQTTAAFVIFTGSTFNGNESMLHFLDTTRGGPGTAGWSTQSVSGAGVATCLMEGNTSYLQFRYSTASMVANASLTWNSLMKVPYDVNPTMTRLHDIVVRYTFTSTIPAVNFYANNETIGGTEGAPVWGSIIDGTSGVRFGSSSATVGNILANIPLVTTASYERTGTAFVTTT